MQTTKSMTSDPVQTPTRIQRLVHWLKKDYWQYLVLVLPALILYTVFSIAPVLYGARVATTNLVTPGTSSEYVGLANISDILAGGGPNSDKFYEALRWTATYWLGNWAMIFLLGFVPALILYERIRLKNSFLIIIFLPYVISNLALGFVTRMILDPNIGPLNWLLQSLHVVGEPIWFLTDGWPASLTLILLTGWKYGGFNATIFLAGLVAIPIETIEAAKVDGADYFQTLLRVVIPQMWPTIISASILCLTGTWRLFDIPVALAGSTGGGIRSLDVLALVFYRWAFSTVGFGYASAMMVIVSLILLAGSAFFVTMLRRTSEEY